MAYSESDWRAGGIAEAPSWRRLKFAKREPMSGRFRRFFAKMADKTTSVSAQDSLDLNSDYKVWGHMLDDMCHTPVRDMDGLEQRLIDMWSGLQLSLIHI